MRKLAKTRRPAPVQAGSIKDRVVEVRTKDPKVLASRIVETLDHGWVVGCEGDPTCTHLVLVANAEWRPVDFADPNGPSIEIRYSGPGRRFCSAHVPR